MFGQCLELLQALEDEHGLSSELRHVEIDRGVIGQLHYVLDLELVDLLVNLLCLAGLYPNNLQYVA